MLAVACRYLGQPTAEDGIMILLSVRFYHQYCSYEEGEPCVTFAAQPQQQPDELRYTLPVHACRGLLVYCALLHGERQRCSSHQPASTSAHKHSTTQAEAQGHAHTLSFSHDAQTPFDAHTPFVQGFAQIPPMRSACQMLVSNKCTAVK